MGFWAAVILTGAGPALARCARTRYRTGRIFLASSGDGWWLVAPERVWRRLIASQLLLTLLVLWPLSTILCLGSGVPPGLFAVVGAAAVGTQVLANVVETTIRSFRRIDVSAIVPSVLRDGLRRRRPSPNENSP